MSAGGSCPRPTHSIFPEREGEAPATEAAARGQGHLTAFAGPAFIETRLQIRFHGCIRRETETIWARLALFCSPDFKRNEHIFIGS